MHFYLVCNMNKIGRVFVVYILVVAATEAAEVQPKTQANSKSEQASKPKEKPSSAKHISAHAVFNHDMVGVASIAAVDSRNSRVSSVGGVKVYPPMDSSMVKTDSKGNFIFKSIDGKMTAPITITKEANGVSGTIRIAPGSVSVSSSAKSGSASAVSSHSSNRIPDLNPWPMPYMKPMHDMIMHDMFFPESFFSFPSIPNSAYHRRIPKPDFHRIPQPSFPRMHQPAFPRMSQPAFPRMQDPWMDKDMFKHSLPMHNFLTPTWYYPNPFINFW